MVYDLFYPHNGMSGRWMAKIKVSLKEPNIDWRLLDDRGPTPEYVQKRHAIPLDHEHNLGQLSDSQWAAGHKYFAHWFKAGLCEQFAAVDLHRIGGGDPSTGMAKTEQQANHRELFRVANEKIGADAARVLQKVICEEKRVNDVGHELLRLRDYKTARKKVLQIMRPALDTLCDEWGIQRI